jgi:hypothetical protein
MRPLEVYLLSVGNTRAYAPEKTSRGQMSQRRAKQEGYNTKWNPKNPNQNMKGDEATRFSLSLVGFGGGSQ